MAVSAFLISWQATDFALDYRAIMGAVTCAVLASMPPKAIKK
jgi:hypothetical protein